MDRSVFNGETLRLSVFQRIGAECARQAADWGPVEERRGISLVTLPILVEEVGEVARALIDGSDLEGELIQVAAVCVTWLEQSAAQRARALAGGVA